VPGCLPRRVLRRCSYSTDWLTRIGLSVACHVGGGAKVSAGAPIPEEYKQENLELLAKGICNLEKQIQIISEFGVPVVVAVAEGFGCTKAERQLVIQRAIAAGASDAVSAAYYSHGGVGAVDLANAVINTCERGEADFKYVFPCQLCG